MKKVLLVDDMPLVTKSISRLLNGMGLTIKTATNGREAMDSISKTGIILDLVITDWEMPVMGGGELVEELKKLHIKPKIIIMSSNSCIEEEGASAILQKPFSQENFIETVKNILHL